MFISAFLITVITLFSVILTPVECYDSSQKNVHNVIYIKSDGSVSPSIAPISRTGNTYTLESDLVGYSIIIQRDQVIINGSGHRLIGESNEPHYYVKKGIIIEGRKNIMILNVIIEKYLTGIYLKNSRNCVIQNVTIIGPDAANSMIGIELDRSSYNTITNAFIEKVGTGIRIYDSTRNIITNNTLTMNDDHAAIEIQELSNANEISKNRINHAYFGIFIQNSYDNVIDSNDIGVTYAGIFIKESRDAMILRNNLTESHDGIIIISSKKIEARNNTFAYNRFGAYLKKVESISFTFNNFINNTQQVSITEVVNRISFNYNFWNDYKGVDDDHNGIGDEPYPINVKTNFTYFDPSPLIRPTASIPRKLQRIYPSRASDPILYLLRDDKDLDGIRDEIEMLYPYSKWLDPQNKSELISRVISFLKNDGVLDKNEQTLVNFLYKIQNELVPSSIKERYYRAGEIVEAAYGHRFWAWAYIVPNEIKWYQLLLIMYVLNDERVSDLEVKAINFLNNYIQQNRWYLVLDIIASGVLCDQYLFLDFDLDGLNNYEELKTGSNPLNDLETDTSNLSERFVILVPPINCGSPPCRWDAFLELYHALKRHGYDDDHIFMVMPDLYTLPQEYMISFLCHKDLVRDLGDVKVDYYFNTKSYPENIRNMLRNMHKWDGNDEIIVFEIGHGGICEKSGWLYTLLEKWKPYGRVIWFRDTCHAGSFFENYLYKGFPENFVGIASSLPKELGGFSYLPYITFYDFMEIIPRYVEWPRSPFERPLPDNFIPLKNMTEVEFNRMYFYYDTHHDKAELISRWNIFHYIPYARFYPLMVEIFGERAPKEKWLFKSYVTVKITGCHKGAKIQYSFDNNTWHNYNSPFTVNHEGSRQIYCRCIDQISNIPTRPLLISIKIDMTPPTIRLKQPTDLSFINSTSVLVIWQGSDAFSGIDHYTLSVDGRTVLAENKTEFLLKGLTEGEHEIEVTAYDQAGHTAKIKAFFTIDITAPRILDVELESLTDKALLKWHVYDALSKMIKTYVYVNKSLIAEYNDLSGSIEIDLKAGKNIIRLIAIDQAGNLATCEKSLTFVPVSRPTSTLITSSMVRYSSSIVKTTESFSVTPITKSKEGIVSDATRLILLLVISLILPVIIVSLLITRWLRKSDKTQIVSS